METKDGNVIIGNKYKYESSNIIVRLLMRGYLSAFDGQTAGVQAARVLEVGCGEGYITYRLADRYGSALTHGLDISLDLVRQASVRCSGVGFTCASAYDIPFRDNSFDLVVCVEALEHMDSPRTALREIRRVCSRFALFSVPREPIWRVLNMARGAYVRDWGNTPGHVQHWSVRRFAAFIEEHFRILRLVTPFPWTMALCEKRE